jgi:hypothetical protein
MLQPQPLHNKYFNNFDAFNTPSTADPVEDWLISPLITTAMNGLQWWAAMAASRYPLSEIGMNFLSIPGVHRCFATTNPLQPFMFSYLHQH